MNSFMYHYFLVTFWGESWIKEEGMSMPELIQAIKDNVDPKEKAWSYKDTGEPAELLLMDAITLMSMQPSEGAVKWLSVVIKYIHDNPELESHTSLMQSMGCGSSDYLMVSKILEYACSLDKVYENDGLKLKVRKVKEQQSEREFKSLLGKTFFTIEEVTSE